MNRNGKDFDPLEQTEAARLALEQKVAELTGFAALKEGEVNVYRDAIGLILWKMRHHLPALVIQITQADREALKQSLGYNEQTVKLNVEDRHGTTLIHLTDEKTGDQIICTENNEADLDRAEAAKKLRMLKQSAPELAAQLKHDLNNGNISESLLDEVCSALVTLGRA